VEKVGEKFQPPKGTRDLMPEDAARMEKIIEIVRATFKSFGFESLMTPAFESFELLSAKGGLGEAVKNEIYYFKDKGDRELGLRFDLTMPLARIVSSNPQIPKPFKRYQIEKVWRYDEPQAKRWREFWQADADIVGSESLDADTEVIAVACKALEALGFKDFKIRVNDRKILDEFLDSIGIGNTAEVFRSVDKLDKIGEAGVKDELRKKGVSNEKTGKIMEFIKSGKDGKFKPLLEKLETYGCKKYIKIDFSLVRGLDYYTGIVFEMDLGAGVSCGSGGRYDRLIKNIGGEDLAATGSSLGLDRILEVMKEKRMFGKVFGKEAAAKVFVANIGETMKDAVRIAEQLRSEGVACQTNLMGWNLTKQLDYADRIGVAYVIIVGEKELKTNKFTLRDMGDKTEEELDLGEIVKIIKTVSRKI